MPYSGGSSTAAGVQYQNWFLALQFSYVFFEMDFAIYPEALKTRLIHVDDICVRRNNKLSFYNVKFRAPSKRLHWSPKNLFDEGVLTDFKLQHKLTPDSDLTFVSESGCYLFSEVFKRARNAIGMTDLETALNSEYAQEVWEQTKTYMNYNDLEMVGFAQKVQMKTIPLEEIQFLLKHRFDHVNHNGHEVSKVFYINAIDSSINKTFVNKDLLIRWLQDESIKI